MFRTSKCSPSGRLVLAVLWYVFYVLPSTRLLVWMFERNTIKLHIQVFLRMNTWMFEACRRLYNKLKHLCKNYILLVLIT